MMMMMMIIIITITIILPIVLATQSIRRGSAAAYLLELWVRIPPVVLMAVCCDCCVLSDRWSSVRRADHFSRGVLPGMLRMCVMSR